jgi:hypothetical protein
MGKYDDEDLSQATSSELREARGVADDLERQMRAARSPGVPDATFERMVRTQRRSMWEAALAFRIRNRRAIDEEFGDR